MACSDGAAIAIVATTRGVTSKTVNRLAVTGMTQAMIRERDLPESVRLLLPPSAAPLRSRTGKFRSARPNARFEDLLAFQIRSARLPEPARQFRFAPPRKFTADFAWPDARLLLEVQGGIWKRGGGAHSHPLDIERDIEKGQNAALGGWLVMPVTTDQCTSGEALQLLRVFFHNRIPT